MTRFPDWPRRLQVFLNERRQCRFSYGSFDCCLFVCDAIRAMTGVDVADSFRGTYHSRRQARSALTELCGYPSVEVVAEQITKQHSMKEVPIAFAQRGDVVIIPRLLGHSLGLVGLNGEEILVAGDGVTKLSLSKAVRAWRV